MDQGTEILRDNISKFSNLVKPRREMYRFLASLFLAPPSKELIDLLISPSFLDDLNGILSEDSLKYITKFCQEYDHNHEALKQEYMDLFMIPLGKYVTPYEAVYRDEREIDGKKVKGLLMGPSTVDVKRFYKKAGAEIEKNFKELPDHIGTELDFLRFLCESEEEAWETGNEQAALNFLKIEKDFLKKHLINWLPDLCEKIFQKTKNNFYLAIAKITLDFVLSDSNTLSNP